MASQTYIFQNNRALRTGPVALADGRHMAARVGLEQRRRRRPLKGVCLDVLVRLALGLEGDPDTLRKGAICMVNYISRLFKRNGSYQKHAA